MPLSVTHTTTYIILKTPSLVGFTVKMYQLTKLKAGLKMFLNKVTEDYGFESSLERKHPQCHFQLLIQLLIDLRDNSKSSFRETRM